jgi:predicted RNA binding protein YcfA (HicA-like mRNA interferase family)
LKYREVEKKLKKLGCFEIGTKTGGSHRKWINPESGLCAAIPDWGSKDLKNGTLRGAIKQLGLEWEGFIKG